MNQTTFPGYDLAVSTIIVHDRHVLFALHKRMKHWVPVGGHVQPGELPEEAALREAREECGLELQLIGKRELNDTGDYRCLLRPAFMDLHRIEGDHWHLGIIYFATVTGGELRVNRSELEDLRWFSQPELDEPRWRLTPALIHYAREALSRVGRQ